MELKKIKINKKRENSMEKEKRKKKQTSWIPRHKLKLHMHGDVIHTSLRLYI